MAQTPSTPLRFITGADIEVNKADAMGIKPHAQPDAEAAEAAEEKALADHSKDELLELAADLEIDGRSGMNKGELIEAIEAAQA